jgi:hypothetical protein
METERGYSIHDSEPDDEKDCPRCSQILGTNPDCDTCAMAAHWTPEKRQELLKEKREKDKKFGLGKKKRY